MTILKVPELPEQYIIKNNVEGISIDTQVSLILEKLQETPILKHPGSHDELQSKLDSTKLPREGVPLEPLLRELNTGIIEYCRRNAHPGCWAYITSPGLPIDPMSHALTAALNQNVTGFHSTPGATIIEQIVIDWMVQLAGLPESAGGLLQGGGSLANLSALTVARNQALGTTIIEHGLYAGPRLVLLVAETVHFSVLRAANILGIGTEDIIFIKVNTSKQMCMTTLEESLKKFSECDEIRVVAVVATAGTTATGSIDPLSDIAIICKRYGVWLHVDAAYGGAALLSEDLRNRLLGIEQANSITIDLHKWFYMSVECSVLLYRNPECARDTFAIKADYVRENRDNKKEFDNFFELSPEVSRRFRALAIWFAFRHYGIDTLGHNVLYNVECAEYLAARVKSMQGLELVGEPQLSICCFRYIPADRKLTDKQLGELNDAIVRELAEQGDFLLSSTQIDKSSVLRVCIRSYTTKAEDVDRLIDVIFKTGKRLEHHYL